MLVSDAYMLVENKRIYINRGLMAVWSPYWFSKYKTNPTYQTVLPPDKHFDDVIELVKIVHMPHERVTCKLIWFCILILLNIHFIPIPGFVVFWALFTCVKSSLFPLSHFNIESFTIANSYFT